MQPWTREPKPSVETPRGRVTPSPELARRLEDFARCETDAGDLMPWVNRLSRRDWRLLRQDLALVLIEEPEITGEPVDWREIEEILRD